jgi:DNA-directed RNA polymerase subunit RPC12/RpoP
MAEGDKRVDCPKCGSSAFGAAKTKIPTSKMYGNYVRLKCFNCGTEFDLTEKT